MDFYQNLMKKEKEAIEESKKKKLKEVELWSRSQREEERMSIEKYAAEKADSEMDKIAESIKQKHESELRDKEMLSSAQDYYTSKMSKLMEARRNLWEEKKQAFLTQQMDKLKEKIIGTADSEL